MDVCNMTHELNTFLRLLTVYWLAISFGGMLGFLLASLLAVARRSDAEAILEADLWAARQAAASKDTQLQRQSSR